jgi:hypothetical protein
MCSIVEAPAGSVGSRLAALVEHMNELGAEVTSILADPGTAAEIAGLPGDALAGFVTSLASTVDAGTAAMPVVTGHVDAAGGRGSGCLIAGRYASMSRFLQVEAGMSKQSASAMIARARDLRGDYAVLVEPWLAGRVSGDAVREMTVGVRSALRATKLPAAERDIARAWVLDSVLPVAEVGTVADVTQVIGRLRLLTDQDGANQAALEAHAEQTLTCEQVGSMSRITAWVTHEVAAAAMTVLERRVATMAAEGDLAPEEQLPPGVDPATWDGRRRVNQLHSHLLALAFGDTVTGLLDDNRVGSHHGIAPHVTVTVDVARFEAGLGGDLAMPGSDDPVPVANETVRRILCDADLTTIITRAFSTTHPDSDTARGTGPTVIGARHRSRTCSSSSPGRSSTSGAPNASSHPGCVARSRPATGTAGSPAATPTYVAATPTTSVSGSTADAPTSTTHCSSACATTTPSTKAAGPSPAPRASHPAPPAAGNSPHPHDHVGPDQQGAPPVARACTRGQTTGVRVRSVASGGHAKRTGAYGDVPRPAETWSTAPRPSTPPRAGSPLPSHGRPCRERPLA